MPRRSRLPWRNVAEVVDVPEGAREPVPGPASGSQHTITGTIPPPDDGDDDEPGLGSADDFEPWLEQLAAAPALAVPRAPPVRAGLVIEDRYRVELKLGQGGMGVVYLARDLVLERPVAIKLHGIGIGDLSVSRLWREAKAMARLSHPNVVTVHEVGSFAGRVFIAMEYVDGGTLRTWLKERARGWPEILAMFLDAGRGLAAAHACGIVHRDFKPDNVLVGSDGRPRVGDFGVARGLVDTPQPARPSAAESTAGTHTPGSISDRLTTAGGAVVGTPAYMAPEQTGDDIDARVDQFAFCVTLFEALHGKRPFRGGTIAEIALAVEAGRIEPPVRAVPQWVSQALARGMAFDRDARFPDMAALLDALQRDPSRARKRWAGLAAVAGVAIVLVATRDPKPEPCADADAPVDEVWNDDARARIREAFANSGSALADSATELVLPALDAHAEALAEMRHEACVATNVRGEQSAQLLDRRMLCLERRRAELVATAEVFAAADARTVARAKDTLDGLGALAECADGERLLAGVPPPAPELADAVADVRDRLAHAHALWLAGRAREANLTCDEALAAARAVDYPPVLAEALVERGTFLGTESRTQEAIATLEDGFYAALQVGHEPPMATASFALVGRAAEGHMDAHQVEHWDRIATALVERAGGDPVRRARLLAQRAHADLQLGRLDDADRRGHEALRLMQEAGEEDEVRAMLIQVGRIVASEGRYVEARELDRLAFEAGIRARGPAHPVVANAAEALGRDVQFTGDTAGAVAMLRVALRIREDAFGPDTIVVADTLDSLAGALEHHGDIREALACYDRALAIIEGIEPRDDTSYAHVLNNAASVLHKAGELERALDYARRGVEVASATFGDDHYNTGLAHGTLASVLAEVEGPEAQLPELEQALERMLPSLGVGHPNVAGIYMSIARANAALGRFAAAELALGQAETGLRTQFAEDTVWFGHLAHARGDVRLAEQRWQDAELAFASAVQRLEAADGGAAHTGDAIRGWARAKLALGEHARARELFERALALLDHDDFDPRMRAAIRFELAQACWGAGDRVRARELAATSHDEIGPARRAEVDAWLAAHRR